MASVTNSTICDVLDRFEGINAAEWDEVPESQSSTEQQAITPTMRLDFTNIENEKVEYAANTVVPALPTRPCAPAKESFKPVKIATCWFWATPNKECRFTAEECRYLHAFLPTTVVEPAKKSTWGAPVHSQSSPSTSHPYLGSCSASRTSNNFRGRTKICWFWAEDGKCNYAAGTCKYLHEHSAEGFAPRPSKIFLPTGDGADNKYKPPHTKSSVDWASGKLIKIVNVSDLLNAETSPKIERCEYLTSYNWLDRPNHPTILVPGSPPLWSPSPSTKRLNEDSGEYFRDPNAARYPRYPIEPVFRALLATHPDADLSSFDIVGCGSTLGNLLRFCAGIDKDFRFDIDRIGDTVFFIRKESSPTALIPNVCGYGHSFPEAHTMWESDVKGSASHQRIIQYDFGGLKFLVRSESDGYLKQAVDLDAQHNDAERANTSEGLLESKETLASETDNYTLLEDLRVSGGPSSTVGPLHIEMRGRRIPQKAIFDLKTRAKETRRPIDMDEVYRRLWVNQTPYFIFAEHFRGSFEPRNIQPVSISDGISKWEKDREELLKHYQAAVMEILAVTKSSATGKLQVIRRGSGSLEIRERIAGDNVLPHDIRNTW